MQYFVKYRYIYYVVLILDVIDLFWCNCNIFNYLRTEIKFQNKNVIHTNYKDVGFVGCISKMAYLFMLNEFVLVDHWLLAEKVK